MTLSVLPLAISVPSEIQAILVAFWVVIVMGMALSLTAIFAMCGTWPVPVKFWPSSVLAILATA